MTQKMTRTESAQKAARARWDWPRLIRLDGLTPAQRMYVLNVVEHIRRHGIPPGKAES